MDDTPLPLIPPSVDYDENAGLDPTTLYRYGYAVLALTWFLFIVTINSVFHFWSYIVEPLAWSDRTRDSHVFFCRLFDLVDYYVVSFWCVYVIAWWWALLLWCGLKLFKQSKGIQTKKG